LKVPCVSVTVLKTAQGTCMGQLRHCGINESEIKVKDQAYTLNELSQCKYM